MAYAYFSLLCLMQITIYAQFFMVLDSFGDSF